WPPFTFCCPQAIVDEEAGVSIPNSSPFSRSTMLPFTSTPSPPAPLAIRKAPSASVESIEPRPPRPCEVGRPKGRRRKNRRQSHNFFLAPAAPLAEVGVFNLLRHFKMLSGEPRRVEHPIWIDRSEVLRSPVTGIFHARVQPDQAVAKGTLLGVLTDFFGNAVQEVRAPFAGVVLYIVATPPVSQGEPLGMVGHLTP